MGTDSARLFNREIADRILATHPDEPELIHELAFSKDEILMDYWGCYARVFAGHPAGSISSLDYLPEQQEEIFLLLRSEHVDQMIKSLREHANDLTVMDEQQIARLEQWRDLCATDHNYLVAYEFDL